MSKFDEYRAYLEELKNSGRAELKFRPIEKWMCDVLGVEKRDSRTGSILKYSHRLLHHLYSHNHFVVHTKHVKRKMIRRAGFLEYLYKRLNEIIDLMELEDKGVI